MVSSQCCKDCRDREIGCHGKCETYLRYRAKQDLLNAMKLKREQKYPKHVKFNKGMDHNGKITKMISR